MRSIAAIALASVALTACVVPPEVDLSGYELVATSDGDTRAVAAATDLLSAADITWLATWQNGRDEILVVPSDRLDAISLLLLVDGAAQQPLLPEMPTPDARLLVEQMRPFQPVLNDNSDWVSVASCISTDALAEQRVWRALDRVGIDTIGAINASGASVLRSRADEARAALRADPWALDTNGWSRRADRYGHFVVDEEGAVYSDPGEVPPFALPDDRVVVAYHFPMDHGVDHPVAVALLAARTDPGSQLTRPWIGFYLTAIDVPRELADRARRVLRKTMPAEDAVAGSLFEPGSVWIVPDAEPHPLTEPALQVVGVSQRDDEAGWNRLYAVARTSGLNWTAARSYDGGVIWSGAEDAEEMRKRLRAVGAIERSEYSNRNPGDFFVVESPSD